jgi:hypothetical protein
MLSATSLDLYTALPYRGTVHAVLETPTFLRDVALSGMSRVEHDSIVRLVARDPSRGAIIPGAGGARKVRFAGRGKGKSGGYRIVTILPQMMYRSCCSP